MNPRNGRPLWCWLAALLFLALEAAAPAGAAEQATKLFYGGFAFAGNAGGVEENYPISSIVNKGGGGRFFETQSRDFFQKNIDQFHAVSLSFDLARPRETPLVLALALSDEKVLREEVGEFHKLVIQLGFELLILDFETMEVVSSRPVRIELIDAGARDFSDAEIATRVQAMVAGADSQLFTALRTKLSGVRVGGKNQANLQIKTVSIGEKALPFLPEAYRKDPRTYAQGVAQQFGSLLTSQAGLAMLPYSKDGLNSKMALRFSDASVLQFKIPAPSFAIDLEVKGFKKVLNKSTDAESLWLYGAFLNVRIYEPEFSVVFYDGPVKYGVSKVVPISQKTVDEFPVVSEAMTGAFLTAIEQMQKNQTTNEKVLKKCQL